MMLYLANMLITHKTNWTYPLGMGKSCKLAILERNNSKKKAKKRMPYVVYIPLQVIINSQITSECHIN